MVLLLFAAVAAAVWGVRVLQRHTYFTQYLYFCRFSVLVGLALAVVLPSGMAAWAAPLLGGLVVQTPTGLFLTTVAATLTAWVVLFTATRTIEVAKLTSKTHLPFVRRTGVAGDSEEAEPRRVHRTAGGRLNLGEAPWLVRAMAQLHDLTRDEHGRPLHRLALYALLALPLVVLVLVRSIQDDPAALGWYGLAVVAGVAVAVGVRWLTVLRPHRAGPSSRLGRAADRLARWVLTAPYLLGIDEDEVVDEDGVDEDARARWPARPEDEVVSRPAPTPTVRLRAHRHALYFASTGIALMGVLWFWTRPQAGVPAVPVVVLLLVLLCVWAFVFSLLASAYDEYRVPLLTLSLTVFFGVYWLGDVDYYYRLLPTPPGAPPEAALAPPDALAAWQLRQRRLGEADSVLTVVAASGGGVTAARWTAEVLTRLEEGLGPAFSRSLLVVSAVSGGSVGTLYFVDRLAGSAASSACRAAATPDSVLAEVRSASGRSSLYAAAHGLVFGDIARSVPLLRLRDRGRHLEEVWHHRMADGTATLRDWRADVRAGCRPVTVFNATIAETGTPFLLSPVDHTAQAPPHFAGLYPDHDVYVATAARLSATFPYVSPIPRPNGEGLCPCDAYHLADGGYYDNSGLVSAMTFVDEALLPPEAPDSLASPVRRIVLVQVRAFDSDTRAADTESGWKYASFGPLVTLSNMRNGSQRLRNQSELSRFIRDLGHRGVALDTVAFSLSERTLPLSWDLTGREEQRIACAWPRQEASYRAVAKALGVSQRPFPPGDARCGEEGL